MWLGNNCKSKCIFELCQDAEADVAIGPGAETQHKEIGNQRERKFVNLDSGEISTEVGDHRETIDQPKMPDRGVFNDRECAITLAPQNGLEFLGPASPRDVKTTEMYSNKVEEECACGPLLRLLREMTLKMTTEEPAESEASWYFKETQHPLKFDPQSGEVKAMVSVRPSANSYQNVAFADEESPFLFDADGVVDPTRKMMDTSDVSLDSFFSRPLKIHELEWATSGTFFAIIDPWSLYLENARVINRLTNYKLFRATLKMKIVINGNAFQFGRGMAAYWPSSATDDMSDAALARDEDIVQQSQWPHVFLNPTTSSGGEIKAPFYYKYNYVSIPDGEWDQMGSLVLRSINQLKHANGAVDKATVSVFAWMEDVQLSMLTSNEPAALTPQSGEDEQDEGNKKHFVSGTATHVAKVMSHMKDLPIIGPFATASEVTAGSVASLAKLLGYSRPNHTADAPETKLTSHSSLALTTVPDGAHKLTVDDKAQLTVDPRIAGVGGADPMDLRGIAMRESYLTSFAWDIGDAPETLLWNIHASPVVWAQNTAANPDSFHFPACAMAALPFKHWTGTMKFRFQVVASGFHRGRLKVVYDPENLSTNEYNTNYLQIIDIAENDDFTIEVGNGQNKSLLTHPLPGIQPATSIYNTAKLAAQPFANGVVGVYVVNELTTPNSVANNNIEVNVFVSAGEDFEVFDPDDHFQQFVFKPQSGEENVDEGMDEKDAPIHLSSMKVGHEYTNHKQLAKVYTGESIKSFRTLLKRYNLSAPLMYCVDGSPRVFYGSRPMFPTLRGNVANAVHTTGLAASYNYVNTVLLHWVTYAHQGWRGAIRWKFLLRGENNSVHKPSTYITRGKHGVLCYSSGSSTAIAHTSESAAAHQTVFDDAGTTSGPKYLAPPSGTLGTYYQNGYMNPCTEVEIPYYSAARFSSGKEEGKTGLTSQEAPWHYRIYGEFGKDTSFDAWCAAGEDFQVYFFTGLPRMYFEAAPPAP